MRHRLKGSKLGRTASHRKATLRSLSIALITHHRVVTTLSKAKELRRHIEPVITRSKEDTTHNRREVFSFIHDNDTVSKLFNEVGPKVADRPGGYTRVIKIGYRTGDSADMAVIELVDYNTTGTEDASKKKKRTRRAGSGKAPVKSAAVAEEVSSINGK
jgi:large subunit ribosomal protein L17